MRTKAMTVTGLNVRLALSALTLVTGFMTHQVVTTGQSALGSEPYGLGLVTGLFGLMAIFAWFER